MHCEVGVNGADAWFIAQPMRELPGFLKFSLHARSGFAGYLLSSPTRKD